MRPLCSVGNGVVRRGTEREKVACRLSGAASLQGDVGQARSRVGVKSPRNGSACFVLQGSKLAYERSVYLENSHGVLEYPDVDAVTPAGKCSAEVIGIPKCCFEANAAGGMLRHRCAKTTDQIWRLPRLAARPLQSNNEGLRE